MMIRPHSQEFIRNNYFNTHQYQTYGQNNNQQLLLRKKIADFSFLPQNKIGRGYSSIVYKGSNDLTNEQVAIKVIQLKSLKDQNSKKFLHNELNCLKSLCHQNLLRYINSYMTSNNCYIITQLYSQGDLSKVLKRKKHLSEDQIWTIFKQFLAGYKHFSRRGFIHRDIKPSNILISAKGLYVIADFGFIQHNYENTKQNYNVGTPVYMAPQSLTQNIYSLKSDIWSIGIMLFQMAFGCLPFKGRAQKALKIQICNNPLNFYAIQRQANIYISDQFINLLSLLLKKNPNQRINLQQMQVHSWVLMQKGKNQTACVKSSVQNFQIKDLVQNFDINNTINFRYSVPYSCDRKNQSKSLNNYIVQKNPQISYQKDQFKQKKRAQLPGQSDKQNLPPNLCIEDKFRQVDSLLQKSNQRSRQFLSNSRQAKFISYSKQKHSETNFCDNQNFKLLQKNIFKDKKLEVNTKKLLDVSNGFPNYKLKITQKKGSKQEIQSKLNLIQGMKSIIDLKKIKKNPIIQTSMHNLMDYNCKYRQDEIQKSSSIKSSSLMKFKSLQLKGSNQKMNDSIEQQNQLSPIEYMIRSIHLLRFVYEIFTNWNKYLDSKILSNSIIKQVRQTLFDYFLQDWLRIQKMCYLKQNILKLQRQKWSIFIKGSKFVVFQNVVNQYKEKFLNHYRFKQFVQERQGHKKSKYFIQIQLKTQLYDILSCFDEHISGFSCINQSQQIKLQIRSIFHLLKLVELTNQRNLLGDKCYLQKSHLKKQILELQGKEQSFKISKMIIQLKKKYYEIQNLISTK